MLAKIMDKLDVKERGEGLKKKVSRFKVIDTIFSFFFSGRDGVPFQFRSSISSVHAGRGIATDMIRMACIDCVK